MSRFHILGAVALWASLAASTPSPQSLNSGLTILMDNDLQGMYESLIVLGGFAFAQLIVQTGSESPKVNSAVILLDSTSYDDAVAGCGALGEELWSPETATTSIQSNLNYLVYEGQATEQSMFWVAPNASSARAISAIGHVSPVNATSLTLPALCTQSAPLANSSIVDTSAKWQVSVRSNNEDLVGSVQGYPPLLLVYMCSRPFPGSHKIDMAAGFEIALPSVSMESDMPPSLSASPTLRSTRGTTPTLALYPLVIPAPRARPRAQRTACSSTFGPRSCRTPEPRITHPA